MLLFTILMLALMSRLLFISFMFFPYRRHYMYYPRMHYYHRMF